MTNNELRAMFVPGQKWRGVRIDADGVYPARDDIRTVQHVGSNEIIFSLEDGAKYHTPFPKACEIVELRSGMLHFRSPRFEVRLERLGN